VDDHRVGSIVEQPEARWEEDPGNPALREPGSGETNHIEILPFEAGTGLLIPYTEGTPSLVSGYGEDVASKSLPF
jgi:hypothetical protein